MSDTFKKPPKDLFVDKFKKDLKGPMEEIVGKVMEEMGFPKSNKNDGKSFESAANSFFGSQRSLSTESRIKALYKYDTISGELLNEIKFSDLAISKKFITYNLETEQVFFLNDKNNLEIRSLIKNRTLKELKPHCWPLSYLSISKDFHTIAYENSSGNFEIWNMDTNTMIGKYDLKDPKIREIETDLEKKYTQYLSGPFGSIICKLNDDGSLLALDAADGQIYIYDVLEKKTLKQFKRPSKNHFTYLEFTKNDMYLLISTYKDESYIIQIK